ncbi:hypothetical protein MY1884_006619 [Beauveria asiatica]
MTQYDRIGEQYTDVFDSLPYRAMEVVNVYAALEPILRPDLHVIEFVCGAGFYMDKLLLWGAGSVTGIDISKRMIELASPRLYSAGGEMEAYDIAFAAWFLNYSAIAAELTAMFTSVAINLKSTGVFIGVVLYPIENLEARVEGTNFITYHLRPSVYKNAARAAGFKGRFKWRRKILLDDEMWRIKLRLSEEEWTIKKKNPHLGILMIWKN